MIITINQVLHLPWLGFFERVAKSDVFVLLDDVQFLKNDFFNRNKIKTKQGALWLTVPVHYQFGQSQNEIQIDNSKDWRKKIWKTLSLNYAKAPHFSSHSAFFEKVYNSDWEKLVDLNIVFIKYIAKQMGISTRFVRSSELELDPNMERSQRLLEICKKLGGDTYFSGQGGRRYLKEDIFKEQNIDITYQDFQHPVYPQLFGSFIPELSAIDLLFNCGPQSLSILLGDKNK